MPRVDPFILVMIRAEYLFADPLNRLSRPQAFRRRGCTQRIVTTSIVGAAILGVAFRSASARRHTEIPWIHRLFVLWISRLVSRKVGAIVCFALRYRKKCSHGETTIGMNEKNSVVGGQAQIALQWIIFQNCAMLSRR